MKEQEQRKRMAKTMAKAWADDAFKQRLLKDPTAVFKEEGVEIPAHFEEVRVIEASAKVFYLMIPPPPAEGELSDEEFSALAGGFTSYSSCSNNGSACRGRH